MSRAQRILLLIALLCSAEVVRATNQYPEILVHRQDSQFIMGQPLLPILEQDSALLIRQLSNGEWQLSSACWRGYIGTWSIQRDSLFLTQLQPCPSANYDQNPFELTRMFLDQVSVHGVFAHWVSDTLKSMSEGNPYYYVEGGILKRYAYPAQDDMIQWIYDQEAAANQGAHPGRPFKIAGAVIVIGWLIFWLVASRREKQNKA